MCTYMSLHACKTELFFRNTTLLRLIIPRQFFSHISICASISVIVWIHSYVHCFCAPSTTSCFSRQTHVSRSSVQHLSLCAHPHHHDPQAFNTNFVQKGEYHPFPNRSCRSRRPRTHPCTVSSSILFMLKSLLKTFVSHPFILSVSAGIQAPILH